MHFNIKNKMLEVFTYPNIYYRTLMFRSIIHIFCSSDRFVVRLDSKAGNPQDILDIAGMVLPADHQECILDIYKG